MHSDLSSGSGFSPVAYELARCHVCGGAETDELASAAGVRDEMELLWEFHTRRVHGDSPPEKLLDRAAFSERPPVRVVRCRECGLVYRNPQEKARELHAAYESEDGLDTTILEALHKTQRRSYRAQARRLSAVAGLAGSGLEVGSYVGAFLAAARADDWRFEGVDINPAAVRFAQGKGFTVTEGSIDAIAPTRRFDAVAIWNCLDQLADPRHVIARARMLLAPRGVLAIRVPNGEAYARWRDTAVNGRLGHSVARMVLAHNNLLTFPYRYGFTLRALKRLLRDAGLETVRIHGDTLVPIADAYTRRWAGAEEKLVKGALRMARRLRITGANSAPWIEVYARARQ